MFENVPTEDLLTAVGTLEHDFEEDMGTSRIEAIVAAERVIRRAQAEQLALINALYEDRQRVIGAFREGDPALHSAGDPEAARRDWSLAAGDAAAPRRQAHLRF